MKLTFPESFQFGTSTSAYQIETAVEHDWGGVKARDGNVFQRTTDHEQRYREDCDIIARLAPHYRMSLMWSRLQRSPYAKFDRDTVEEYHTLLTLLGERKIKIMMVLHHFTNPVWFASAGGWELRQNIAMWTDFARKLVDEFGSYVSSWNTFNEPNLYTSMGWVMKEFPPFKRNLLTAYTVIRNLGRAHEELYRYIKDKYPHHPVGISHNSTVFAAENLAGAIPAKFLDYSFMEFPPSLFESCDFFGLSYYARIGHDPFPLSWLETPEKMRRYGKEHDDMWEYYPQGLNECLLRYWKRYGKPLIVTENGICSNDDTKRVKALKDYLSGIHALITDGVPVIGYYHWSAWDNFEWSLGPSYRFGLYSCHSETKERTIKPSGALYSGISWSRSLPRD